MLAVALAVGLGPAAMAQSHDAQIQFDAVKVLNNPRFANVQAEVHNGTVVLRGSVALYSDKEDADRKMHHLHNVLGVENAISVGGANAASVEDETLAKRVADKLATDRVGYGTTPFNSITIGVRDGVVTLGGTAYSPTDKDVAMSDTERTPGVRDVIDDIKVEPTSPMDDQLRIVLYREDLRSSAVESLRTGSFATDPDRRVEWECHFVGHGGQRGR